MHSVRLEVEGRPPEVNACAGLTAPRTCTVQRIFAYCNRFSVRDDIRQSVTILLAGVQDRKPS